MPGSAYNAAVGQSLADDPQSSVHPHLDIDALHTEFPPHPKKQSEIEKKKKKLKIKKREIGFWRFSRTDFGPPDVKM
jgi:hypothetical protein